MAGTALIDYHMGNLGSVTKALNALGAEGEVISSPLELKHFSRCLLPGVGNFGEGMKQLRAMGFEEPLKEFALAERPVLGICMGMQMLLSESEEAPDVPGLNLIPGTVRRFPAEKEKIPHMGWNSVSFAESPFFEGIPPAAFFYFVHSFYAETACEDDTLGHCEYILPFAASVGRGKLAGVQFHPEKSQKNGLKILENFLRIS